MDNIFLSIVHFKEIHTQDNSKRSFNGSANI